MDFIYVMPFTEHAHASVGMAPSSPVDGIETCPHTLFFDLYLLTGEGRFGCFGRHIE